MACGSREGRRQRRYLWNHPIPLGASREDAWGYWDNFSCITPAARPLRAHINDSIHIRKKRELGQCFVILLVRQPVLKWRRGGYVNRTCTDIQPPPKAGNDAPPSPNALYFLFEGIGRIPSNRPAFVTGHEAARKERPDNTHLNCTDVAFPRRSPVFPN